MLTPSLGQQADAIEIEAARRRISTLRPEPGETLRAAILRYSQKASDTGRDNPLYDPTISRDFRIATQRMVGNDPGYAGFIAALDATARQPGAPNPGGPPPYQPPLREPIGAIPGSNVAQRTRAALDRIGPRQADLPAPAPFYSPAGREPIGAETLAETRATSRASMDKWRRAVDRSTMEQSVEAEILNNPPTREPIGARGIGTHARPYRPRTERAFRDIRAGDFYINPADGRVYRKR